MIIKSYLAYPTSGKRSDVALALKKIAGCEVLPATNQDVLVLVTESTDDDADRDLAEQLKRIPNLQSITLVSGFNEAA